MEPRISIIKFGEYMTATPSRRKQILHDQKNPSAFKVARYKDARAVIVEFMEQGMAGIDEARLTAVELRKDLTGTDFTVQDRQLSADAIHDFLSVSGEIETDDLSVHGGNIFASEMIAFGGTKVP